MARLQSAQRIQKEAQDAQLEKDLRQADLKAVLAKVESDFKVLKEHLLPGDNRVALKNARDLKYLRDRQRNPSHVFL